MPMLALSPSGLARFLFELDNLVLAAFDDLLALYTVVYFEIIERAQTQVIQSSRGGWTNPVDGAEQCQGLETFGRLDGLYEEDQ